MDVYAEELIKPIGQLREKIKFLENLREFYQEVHQNFDLSETSERANAQCFWDEADRQLGEANETLERLKLKQ